MERRSLRTFFAFSGGFMRFDDFAFLQRKDFFSEDERQRSAERRALLGNIDALLFLSAKLLYITSRLKNSKS